MRKRFRMLAVVVPVAVIAAACAVVPSYTASTSTFEGFPVISYVPQSPTGVVFLFHGTSGSAAFATKLETIDMFNHLVARGYGFVSTDSTKCLSTRQMLFLRCTSTRRRTRARPSTSSTRTAESNSRAQTS